MAQSNRMFLIDAMISIIRNSLTDASTAKAAAQIIYADGMFNMRIAARKQDGTLSEEKFFKLSDFAEEIEIDACAIARSIESDPKDEAVIHRLRTLSDRLAKYPV